jgi:hypothetical protein
MRDFHVIDLGNAADSSDALSRKLNNELQRRIPNREVHFLQAVSHDKHIFVFVRELDHARGK